MIEFGYACFTSNVPLFFIPEWYQKKIFLSMFVLYKKFISNLYNFHKRQHWSHQSADKIICRLIFYLLGHIQLNAFPLIHD